MAHRDPAKLLAEVEKLLEGDELGRHHPELGNLYDQMDPDMRRTTDSIVRTSLVQRKAKLMLELGALSDEGDADVADTRVRQNSPRGGLDADFREAQE